MSKRTPHIFWNVWNNFRESLRPRRIKGDFKGEDYKGTKYFEIPPNPSIGKRKPSRWYEPVGGEPNFDKEIPSEWMSWLRFRREQPPTKDEIDHNLAIMEMKQKNAAILEAKADEERKQAGRELTEDVKGLYSFPKYKEYNLPSDYEDDTKPKK